MFIVLKTNCFQLRFLGKSDNYAFLQIENMYELSLNGTSNSKSNMKSLKNLDFLERGFKPGNYSSFLLGTRLTLY